MNAARKGHEHAWKRNLLQRDGDVPAITRTKADFAIAHLHVVNLAPALLGVPLKTYVIGTFLGIIPGTTAFSVAGAGLGSVGDESISKSLRRPASDPP